MSNQTHDIVDTAVAAGTFKTLVAAVGAAGLVETLKGAGPFTVFAPSDEAFAK
ncbi:MAG: fasciclin domain-containing protein, partial [Moraxellaceae bacterium]|nr:fasciclin domain-containing protein [Pseudobdellovibrionaceae bacterium]